MGDSTAVTVDATLLSPLTEQVAMFADADRIHQDVWSIGATAEAWARRAGLIVGEPDTAPLERARFERLAARVFPAAAEERVGLYARWLIWLYAFDDARDDGPVGGSATAVDDLYGHLLMSLRRGGPRPGADPLELALNDLWRATAPAMTPEWRRRFLTHLERHRAACVEEAVNRRTGRVPAPADYPSLRRRALGRFTFDLVEPVLGIEVPAPVVATAPWQSFVEGLADLTAWCNDVASYALEAARGDPHNYVTVLAAADHLDPGRAAGRVVERIAERAGEIAAAAHALPADLTALGVPPGGVKQAGEVAAVLVRAQRAHLEWLCESGRYTPGRAFFSSH
ncbi:MAG TPA: terpene synthase family protein [Streptosporangiaceae bacterium]|nr:terpene synthase family protein [Streptosporangiaceae bacterium]